MTEAATSAPAIDLGRLEVADRLSVLISTFSDHVQDHPWMMLSASTGPERKLIFQAAVQIEFLLTNLHQAVAQEDQDQ